MRHRILRIEQLCRLHHIKPAKIFGWFATTPTVEPFRCPKPTTMLPAQFSELLGNLHHQEFL